MAIFAIGAATIIINKNLFYFFSSISQNFDSRTFCVNEKEFIISLNAQYGNKKKFISLHVEHRFFVAQHSEFSFIFLR